MRNTTLNIRTTDHTKHLLQQAANMLGTTVSGFLLNAATDKAHEIIQNQNHFALGDKQWRAFCDVLDRAPSSNAKLKSLMMANTVFKDE